MFAQNNFIIGITYHFLCVQNIYLELHNKTALQHFLNLLNKINIVLHNVSA